MHLLRRFAGLLSLAALAAACNEQHPRSTLDPVADSGRISAWFYNMYVWLDVAIFVLVAAIFVAALLKFRQKDGDNTLPEQSFGNMKLEVAWTILPTLIVVGVTVPTLAGIFKLAKKPDVNQRIIEIEVTGKQWWWEFDYKKEGINTANEVHVPVGAQVVMHMTSADVIHSWWVPRVGGKRDATPGRTQPFYFRADKEGMYDGQCAELCGASHALMGTRLFVESDEKYQAWVKANQAPTKKPTTPQQEAGKKVFMSKGCVACHSIAPDESGEKVSELAARQLTSGPNLSHVGSRSRIAGSYLENTPDNIKRWVLNPQAVKPNSTMTNLNLKEQEAADVAAYLTSLK
jgi:cytochrome c oxidase subunit 2